MQGIWFLPSLIFGGAQGFTSGNWQMFIFSLVSLGVWPLSRWFRRNREFNLEGEVRFDGHDVWIGSHRLPRREIFWRRDWHKFVWDGLNANNSKQVWPELLAAAAAAGFRGQVGGANWIGLDEGGHVDFDLATAGPHLLIVGATGTGKSELLRLLVAGWLNQADPLDLALIDFKGGATMARFAKHPRVVGLATDLDSTSALAIAQTLERQLASRQQTLADSEVSDIDALWKSGGRLRRQVIVIDELGELLRQHPRLVQVLEQIAARGRSLGMHLVVTNQSMAGISRNLLVNLRARVAIGDIDPIDASQLGFRMRIQPRKDLPKWRSARLKTGSGFELEFSFPIGF